MQSSSRKQESATHKLLGAHGTRRAARLSTNSGTSPVDEAIASFEAARAALAHFRQEHGDLLDQYAQLQSNVEACCDEVKQQYLAHKDQLGAAYGGFTMVTKRSVDANKLVELDSNAVAIVKFTLTVGELDELVAAGHIDEDIAAKVTLTSESVRGPKL